MHHLTLFASFCLENEIHKKQLPSECYRKDVLRTLFCAVTSYFNDDKIVWRVHVWNHRRYSCFNWNNKRILRKVTDGVPLTEFLYRTTDGQVCNKTLEARVHQYFGTIINRWRRFG